MARPTPRPAAPDAEPRHRCPHRHLSHGARRGRKLERSEHFRRARSRTPRSVLPTPPGAASQMGLPQFKFALVKVKLINK